MRSAATSFKNAMNSPFSLCSPTFLTTPGIKDWIISMSSLLFCNRTFRCLLLNFALFRGFFYIKSGDAPCSYWRGMAFWWFICCYNPFMTLLTFIRPSSFHSMEWQCRFLEMPKIDYAIGTCFDRNINHHFKHQSHSRPHTKFWQFLNTNSVFNVNLKMQLRSEKSIYHLYNIA